MEKASFDIDWVHNGPFELRTVVPWENNSKRIGLLPVLERLPCVKSATYNNNIIIIEWVDTRESSILRYGNEHMATGAIYRYILGLCESVRCGTCGGYLSYDASTMTKGEVEFKNQMGYDCACGNGEDCEFMLTFGMGFAPEVHPGTIHEVNGKKMKVTRAAREQDNNGEWNLNIYGVPVD